MLLPPKKFTWLGDYKHLQFWIPHSSGLKVDVEDIFKSMIILSWCYYPEKIKNIWLGDYKHLQFWIPHSSWLKVDIEDMFTSIAIFSFGPLPVQTKNAMAG